MKLNLFNTFSKLFKHEKSKKPEEDLNFEIVEASDLNTLVEGIAYAMLREDYIAVIYEDLGLGCGILSDPIAHNRNVKKYLIPARRIDAVVYLVKREDALETLRQHGYNIEDSVVVIEIQWNKDEKKCQLVAHHATNEKGKISLVYGVIGLVQLLNTLTVPERIEFRIGSKNIEQQKTG